MLLQGHRLFIWGQQWSYMNGNDKAAIKKKNRFCPQAWREMNQRERSKGRGGCWDCWQRPVWGLLRFLAGKTWTTPKLQHFTTSIPSASPQVWRGQREILPITESEVSTPPPIVNGAISERLPPSSPSSPPSLSHYSVVCIWLQVGFITPPHSSPPHLNCNPGGVYGEADRMFGPPWDQSLLK